MPTPITIQNTYRASIQTVWEAITDLGKMQQWYFPMLAEFEAQPGFETRFDVENNGKIYVHIWKIKEVIPLKKISYEWKFGGYRGDSLLTMELFAEDEATRIVLTHEGVETFEPDRHPELSKENFIAGWTSFIGTRLKEYVESDVE